MCFAPTPSGKGVGLVIPTLLTWPHSAVVHGIKGENWQLTAGWRSRFSHCLLATIGTFTAGKDGYAGTIRTLTISVKARIVANEAKKSNAAPDFRVYAGRAELGAAWKQRTSGDKPRNYLSVLLDDPSFAGARPSRVVQGRRGCRVSGVEPEGIVRPKHRRQPICQLTGDA